MIGSTKPYNKGFMMFSRALSYFIVVLVILINLFFAHAGYMTWIQDFYNHEQMFIAAIVLMLFVPGVSLLLVSIYFFIFQKVPYINLLGVFAMFPLAFIHFIVTVPVIHSSVYRGFWIGFLELILMLVMTAAFHCYIYNNRGK